VKPYNLGKGYLQEKKKGPAVPVFSFGKDPFIVGGRDQRKKKRKKRADSRNQR